MLAMITDVLDFFAAFVYGNRKNREYFILKGGVSLSAKFIDKKFPIFSRSPALTKACFAVLGNMAETNDNKILLWVVGAVPSMIDHVAACLKADPDPAGEQIGSFEMALYSLWRASIDCEDV